MRAALRSCLAQRCCSHPCSLTRSARDEEATERREELASLAKAADVGAEYRRLSKTSGLLFPSVSLSLFDSKARPDAPKTFAVATLTGTDKYMWTRRIDGDGVWRLFPLLEGPPGSSDYLSTCAPPRRAAPRGESSSAGALCLPADTAIPITLKLGNHRVPGLKRVTLAMLCGFEPRPRNAPLPPDVACPDPQTTEAVAQHNQLLVDKLQERWKEVAVEQGVLDTHDQTLADKERELLEASSEPKLDSPQALEEAAAEEADVQRDNAPSSFRVRCGVGSPGRMPPRLTLLARLPAPPVTCHAAGGARGWPPAVARGH